MSDDNIKPSALVISADSSVVEAIIGNNSTDQKFNARESVSDVLDNTELLEGNGIIIFDIDSSGGGVEAAIDQAIQCRTLLPLQEPVFIIIFQPRLCEERACAVGRTLYANAVFSSHPGSGDNDIVEEDGCDS